MATLRRVGSPVWAPHQDNQPQNAAFESEADETLFGGAAGGGKSDLLLGIALTRHKRAVIFRKQKQDAQALIERAGEILGDYGQWNSSQRSYRTKDDRYLEFGHCSRPGDEESWQGRPHDLKGFDELAHFTRQQYLFLSAWNRSSDPNQRCRIAAASNPPTSAEGAWIIERWAPWLDDKYPNPARPGELRWFATIDGKDTEVDGPEPFEHDGEMIEPRSRTFIPAKLDDNPYYRKSGYRAVLQAMPEPLRSILLQGKFDAAMDDDPWQVIPTTWVEAAMQRWTEATPGPMDVAGIDVARGGAAQTVIAPRHGVWYAPLQTFPGIETPTGVAAAGLVVRHLRDGAVAQVDSIGVGASCYDQLTQMGVPAASMDARAGSKTKDRAGVLGFKNKRSQWWWNFREALDPESGDNVALPPDSELKADLCAPTWKPIPDGIQVEAKEDIEERLGRSVDKGDAVVMGWQQEVDPIRRAKQKANRPMKQNRNYSPQRWRQ